MQKDEEKNANKHQKSNLLKQVTEIAKMNLQIMIAKRPQIEKVLQTLTAKGDFDVTLGRLGATLGVLWGPFGVTGG